ncbi:MAG TPA: hypothetical protein VJQ54_25030, partial [Candidatus Sulfotelmatobacter sp.]|nr:hypothetical protein [Candidatus Sulfotelmatobacter sp.]
LGNRQPKAAVFEGSAPSLKRARMYLVPPHRLKVTVGQQVTKVRKKLSMGHIYSIGAVPLR